MFTLTSEMKVDREEDTKYELYEVKYDEKTDPIQETSSNITYEVDNKTYYRLEREKKDHLEGQEIVPRDRVNVLKMIAYYTYIIPTAIMAGTVYLLAKDKGSAGCALGAVGIVGYLWAFAETNTMSTYLHPEEYSPPPLPPQPQRKEDERFIYVSNVRTIENTPTETFIYNNFSEYRNEAHIASQEEEWEEMNIRFKDSLQQLLTKAGYRDTTQKLFAGSWNTYYLEAEMQDVKIHQVLTSLSTAYSSDKSSISGFIKMKVDMEWRLVDYLSGEVRHKDKVTTESPFVAVREEEEDPFNEGLLYLLRYSLASFLNDEDTKPHLKSSKAEQASKLQSWDTLSLKASKKASSIQDVVRCHRQKRERTWQWFFGE
jgi:hypothetical protein